MKLPELLAPAGDFNKLKTALYFGADAIYIGGNNFSLRRGAKNFDNETLAKAVEYTHSLAKKLYVAVNIFACNNDFLELGEYLKFLSDIKVDAVIVADAGVLSFVKEVAPKLEIHLSTQANTTNKYSAKFWAEAGVSRIVLARETSLAEILEIKEYLKGKCLLEVFAHGAMCVAYSGRCLLSNVLTGRNGNRGECVQACRWEYEIREVNRGGDCLTIGEERGGTYILNSKDLNMLSHIDKLIEAGVDSLKIEGRMKSQYYVASVVNAYRRVIDLYAKNNEKKRKNTKDSDKIMQILARELEKTSHRDYTTGFYFKDNKCMNSDGNICLDTSKPKCEYDFMAEVKGYDEERRAIIIEQRNRFRTGERLEILCKNDKYFNTDFIVPEMLDIDGNVVIDAKNVQQILYIPSEIRLENMDILRKEVGVGNEK